MDFDTAQLIFARSVSPVGELVKVRSASASGRVLAHDFVAIVDVPPASVSTTDGYAVQCVEHMPGGHFTVQQYVSSRGAPAALRAGHTSWVPRGMAMPCGADAVVPARDASLDLKGVSLLKASLPGDNVFPRGSDATAGQRLIPRGTLLLPVHIGAIALQEIDVVTVYREIKVGVGILGQPDRCRSAHGLMLDAMIGEMGALVTCLKGVRDYRALRDSLDMLSKRADVILLVAPANTGEPLSTAQMLAGAGVTMTCEDVVMAPGECTSLGQFGQTPVACLPDSLAGTLMSFALLVTPMLRTLQGRHVVFPPADQRWIAPETVLPRFRQEDVFWCAAQHIGQDNRAMYDGLRSRHHRIGSTLWPDGVNAILRAKPQNDGLEQGRLLAYYDLCHWLR